MHPRGSPRLKKRKRPGQSPLKLCVKHAEALECQFVYAFVPTKPLDDILYDQAVRKVRNELARLNHTMRLENQALTPTDLKDEERRLVGEWLTHTNRRLWEKE